MQEIIEYLRIEGTVMQILFQNKENGYAVLRIDTSNGDEITATGCIPNVGLGENLALMGQWTTHPSYGEQFVTEMFERTLPTSKIGMIEYLGSGIIKGIGKRIAVKIVEKFGEDTFDIIENDIQKLTNVQGITEKKAMQIQKQFLEQSDMRLLMDFLNENNLPLSLTPPLYKRHGSNAIDVLTENPYILCDSYYQVDFNIADELGSSLGLPRDSNERVDAGVRYALEYNLGNGHTFLPVEKLIFAVTNLLSDEEQFNESLIQESMARLQIDGMIVGEHICKRDAVYLKQMHEAESYLSEMLREMAMHEYTYDFDIEELLETLESGSEIAYAPLQRDAISCAAKHGLVILTGGPGTGKTTTVRGMLRVFEALGLNVELAAPTGRAAKRLSDLCEMEGRTIHRLLEAGYAAGGQLAFQRNSSNLLDCDVVVLDEVSMVDISLMKSLVEALPYGARLVLVGDADQLPPVGPGNFLRDVISSGVIPIIRLNEIFRQAQQSDIVMNAHAINSGELPKASKKDGDFFMIKKYDSNDIISTVTELCKKRLPDYYGIDSSQIQVITPSKRQGAGTYALNNALQEALNPPMEGKTEKRFGDTIFRSGDRVMQIRNNYDIMWETKDGKQAGTGMFNGDVGEIVQIFNGQECLIVSFDDKLATYTFDMLSELELAYAMTVHKSQGSEFEAVVIALSSDVSRKLLTRNILYTAITRAKKLLVVVGSTDAMDYMVKHNTKGKRYSALRARLAGEQEE